MKWRDFIKTVDILPLLFTWVEVLSNVSNIIYNIRVEKRFTYHVSRVTNNLL